MTGTGESLDFEFHRKQSERRHPGDGGEVARHYQNGACLNHARAVVSALRNMPMVAMCGARIGLTKKQARYYIREGVEQRLHMMRRSFSDLMVVFPPNRTDPLTLDEFGAVTRDLNSIYNNIAGTTDNLAQALLCEFPHDKELSPLHVGLFKKALKEHPSLISLHERLTEFAEWHIDLKDQRDPAVHRIPLTVPFSLLTPDEQEIDRELQCQIDTAMAAMDFDRVNALLNEQRRLGKARPLFHHHVDEDPSPIYPTVADDIGKLIVVTRRVLGFLRETISSRPDHIDAQTTQDDA